MLGRVKRLVAAALILGYAVFEMGIASRLLLVAGGGASFAAPPQPLVVSDLIAAPEGGGVWFGAPRAYRFGSSTIVGFQTGNAGGDVKAVIAPPGTARPDWEIVAGLAKRLGLSGFDYAHRDEVWNDFIRCTAGRPCNMAGMTADRLRRVKSLQWPCPDVAHSGTKRRYLDRRFPTPDGRARFWPRPHQGPRETTDHEFPLALTTGRLYAHWHSLTRTGKSAKLMKRDPAPYIELHPDDAERLHVAEGTLVQVTSRRGTIRLAARLCDSLRRGMVFVPFHWGDLWSEGNAANYLTISAIGRIAKQPELKFCAVSVEPVVANGITPAANFDHIARS
jgi:ferredoxin-nitrate reductase